MTRGIVLADVRFGLDDDTAGDSFIRATFENRAE
jgi:hypothetical protein